MIDLGRKTSPPDKIEVVEYAAGAPGYRDAAAYDQKRYQNPVSGYKLTVMTNALSNLIGPLTGKHLLDVGCGTGRGVVNFGESAALAVGSDFSFDMLSVAARKAGSRPNCTFVRAVAQQLPFRDGTFDVVTALNFLHLFSLATQRAMVAEMKRVVRPGGIVVLEFDNALHGLVLGLYKRWFGDERGSLPWEIRYVVGDDCRVAKKSGAVFPVVWRAFSRLPRIFIPLEKLAYIAPFSHLAHRIYWKLVKPDFEPHPARPRPAAESLLNAGGFKPG
jgi:ubiquinone/menaquinone biosynthesis C-methylase UbiE